jgi:hypothetical protein
VRRLDQVSQDEAGRELAADLLGQRVAVLDRAIAVDGPAFGAGQVEGGKGDAVADDELAPRSSAPGSKMYRSGLRKPVSSRPPGRSTRKHSRQTGARSGQKTFDTGLNTRSKGEGAQVPHVTEHGPDGQAVPGRDLLVAAELPG